MPDMITINDQNWQQFTKDQIVDGERKARGAIPRNYFTHPAGFYASSLALDFPVLPEAEYPDRIADQERDKSSLQHICEGIPSRDQNGRGYCWKHSGTTANIACRARDNQPYVDLSAYAGACIIKDYADEGGWGAQGVDWSVENGDPSSEFWPQQATDRKYDTPEMRANAKKHRIVEGWWDVQAAQYDRNLTKTQLATCLLLNIPCVVDYNWWSHSVCAIRLISWNPFKILIWNSWGDSWSDKGRGILEGTKAVPDGACAVRVVGTSTD